MKNLKFIYSIIVVIFLSTSTQAHFIDKLAKKDEKKVEREVEKQTEKRVNKGIDNVFDGVEDGFDETVEDDPEKQKEAEKNSPEKTNSQTKKEETNKTQNTKVVVKQEPTLTWNKYDFIPGTEIIFEDDFVGESNGEFPSRWDVTKGTVEITNWGGENVVWLKKTNANAPDAILPYLKNRYKDYFIFLYDSKNQMKILSPPKPICITSNQITYDLIEDSFPKNDKNKPKEGRCHVAILSNKRALKGYLDDIPLVSIPNFNPTEVMISTHNVLSTGKLFIKNVCIAKGAVPFYDKFFLKNRTLIDSYLSNF